jgi:hypothetical protein
MGSFVPTSPAGIFVAAVVCAAVGAGVGGGVGGGAAWAGAHDDDVVDDLFVGGAPVDFSGDAAAVVDLAHLNDDADVIARAAWDDDVGAVAALRSRARPLSSSSFIVVHHSDFYDSPGPAAILDYHRGPAGFSDIGYHFVVGADGAVYAARAINKVGAHAGISREQRRDVRKDPDEDSIGVVLDGNFVAKAPSSAQLTAAAQLIAQLRARYQIPGRHVIGHRHVKTDVVEAAGLTFAGTTTVCPGDALSALLPALRVWSAPLSVHQRRVGLGSAIAAR